MVEQAIVDEAARLLLEAAPGSQVILFGSHGRGTADRRSDLDFLVVEPRHANPFSEMVRLRQVLEPVLRPYLLAADVLVVSAENYDRWKDTPNTIYNEAKYTGRLYERIA
jgi:predicted nucleotidyltransferase